jgi:hypothetical protein
VVEEEFREKGQILSEKFVVLPINLPHCVPAMVVDFRPRWYYTMLTGAFVFLKDIHVTRVSKAPATDVESIGILGDEVFRVDGLVPWLEQEIAQYDVVHVAIRWSLQWCRLRGRH